MSKCISAIAILMLAAASWGQATPRSPLLPAATAPTRPATSSNKIPVPDGPSLRNALKLVNDIYKDELAKARTPEQKQALAKAILVTAGEEKNAASRFALLTTAMDLAVAAGDWETASASIDRLDSLYEVDALKLRCDAVTSLARTAGTPEQGKALVVCCGNLIDAAVNADRYDIARLATAAALSAARNDPALQKDAAGKTQDVNEAQAAYIAARSAVAVLETNPKDAEANLTVGKYRCFIKGDWDAGLAMLAISSDDVLKGVAKSDRAGSKTFDEQIKLGDAWWDQAEKATGLAQRHIRLHAAKSYLAAVPSLAGLEKLRVQKRIDSTTADNTPPAPAHKTIDLMSLVDTNKDTVSGPWLLKDKTLKSDSTNSSRIELPYHPPAEYDVHIEFTREQGEDSVNVILAAAGRHFMWTLGGWKNTVMGFDEVAHVRANQNPRSTTAKSILDNGKRYDVVVKVRKIGVEASVNGKLVGQWKTDYSDMGIPDNWNIRDAAALGLATNKSATTFFKIEVTEVSGAGTLTRK